MEVFLTLSFAAGVICRSYYAVKSGKVPYEMIPFGECQTEPGWKHREQQDGISECPPSLLGMLWDWNIPIPWEWSTRFSSESAGRCSRFGEPTSSLFVL